MSGLPDGVGGRTSDEAFTPDSVDPLDKFQKDFRIYRIVEYLLACGRPQ